MSILDFRSLDMWLTRHRPDEITQAWEALVGCRLKRIYESTAGPHGSPDPVECLVLYLLACESQGHIVESGCWRARSTCFLAASGKRVISVDWFKGDTTGGDGADKQQAETTLAALGLNAEIIEQDLFAADWPGIARDAGMLFYDADHNVDPILHVLRAAIPAMRDRAIIVVHDAYWQESQAALAVLLNEGLIEKRYTLPVWEGLGIYQKI